MELRSAEQSADAASPEVTATAVYLPEEFIFPRYYSAPYSSRSHPAAGTRPVEGRGHELVALMIYLSPVLLTLCTVGNVVGVIVLRRFYSGVLSTAFYVFLGLMLDTVVMWSRCGFEWLGLVTDKDLRDLVTSSSIVLCKVYPFLSNLALHLDSWLLVVMAGETVFVYQRPQRLMKVCRIRRSRLVTGGIFICLCLINSQCFWTYGLLSPFSDETPAKNDDDDVSGDDDDDVIGVGIGSVTVCANWIVQSPGLHKIGSGLDIRRMFVMIVDLVIADVAPFFVIFSCCVMLLTKRVKRRDQVRQIDNTWKACNVDSSAAHQLHTCFIALCILHTILLFPKITYKSFLFVTDLQASGLLQHSVGFRSSAVVARAVCQLLHFVYLSCKVLVFLAASQSFRRECRRSPATCFRPTKHRGIPEDDVHVISGDHVATGLPLLPPHAAQVTENSQLVAADSKYDTLTSATILENGAPCIKIFSMTSV